MAEQVNTQNELNIKDIWERLIILGYYDTAEELTAAHETGTIGDCYKVGDDLYTWDGSQWVDIGRIKGDKGETSYDAATAGKLKSPVNLSVTDGDGGHKGVAAPFDGSGDVALALPDTIKATLEGNASTATTAAKLGTATVGAAAQPIWLDAGAPKVCTLPAANAADYVVTAKSASGGTGYLKFASGVILQWGYVAANQTSITFPMPFTTTAYRMFFSDYTAPGGGVETFGLAENTTTVATITPAPASVAMWFAIGI